MSLDLALALLGQDDAPDLSGPPMNDVRCAWCGKDLGKVEAAGASFPAGAVSHGICPDCASRMLEEYRKTRLQGFRRRAGPLDYGRQSLAPDVWDTQTNPPTLKRDVVQIILHAIHELGQFGIEDTDIDEVFVAGSITGTQWDDDSDLDVQLVVDVDERVLDLLRHSIGHLNDEWTIGNHPVHFFVLRPADIQGSGLRRYDAVYNVLDQRWVKGPVATDLGDPEAFERAIYDRAEAFAQGVDLDLGRTRRDARDLAHLRRALQHASPEVRDRVQSRIEAKLAELGDDVDDLIEDLDRVHRERADAFQRALESGGETSPNLLPENLVWKLLERWRYVQTLRTIAELAQGGLSEAEQLQLAVNT